MGEKFDAYYKWLGIPPKDQPPHHYRLLGIEIFEEDREVIDAAANRLMGYLKDLAVGDEGTYTQNLLNEISRARLCLLNKKKKPAYDQQLRSQLEAADVRKSTVKGPPPKATKRTGPPPAVPPSAAAPPSGLDSLGMPKTISPAAPPDDAFNIVAVRDKGPRSTAKTSLKSLVEPGENEKVRQPAANESPSRARRHGRGVYAAATLIAIVGGIGLILIIIMSYLLLTSGSGSDRSANAVQATDEQARLVLEMSEQERDTVAEFLLNDSTQPLPLKDEYVLEEGRHRIILKRPGYEDFFDSATLVKGQRKAISPQWIRVNLDASP